MLDLCHQLHGWSGSNEWLCVKKQGQGSTDATLARTIHHIGLDAEPVQMGHIKLNIKPKSLLEVVWFEFDSHNSAILKISTCQKNAFVSYRKINWLQLSGASTDKKKYQ